MGCPKKRSGIPPQECLLKVAEVEHFGPELFQFGYMAFRSYI